MRVDTLWSLLWHVGHGIGPAKTLVETQDGTLHRIVGVSTDYALDGQEGPVVRIRVEQEDE